MALNDPGSQNVLHFDLFRLHRQLPVAKTDDYTALDPPSFS